MKVLKKLIYNLLVLIPVEISHQIILRRIRKKGQVKVMFLASNLSMWKYEKLIDKLSFDERFEISIILVPFLQYGEEERKHSLNQLAEYFDSRNLQYLNSDSDEFKNVDLIKRINPDMVFYQQPYAEMLEPKYDSSKNFHRLLCYFPYGLSTFDADWQYHLKFNNVAWKLYYSIPEQKIEAINRTYNDGRNMVVVGYSDFDKFSDPHVKNVWKYQSDNKKRIIWAPHFSISPGLRLHRDSFLWMSSMMIDLAHKYEGKIQFAFKPHPNLLQELYNHPDWGRKKADEYYDEWRRMSNGQLDEGDFIDLFKTSDAMIHDCGSFTAEYHYTQKPVMFVCRCDKVEEENFSSLGREAMSAHYIGNCREDIISFIESVVLGGNDYLSEKRRLFFEKYLLPPGGNTMTENVYLDLMDSLKLTR